MSIDILRRLEIANRQRAKEFSDYIKFKSGDFIYYSNALAGEVGELCNLTKKLSRGDRQSHGIEIFKCIDDEAADVLIQLDLFCQVAGVNIKDALVRKFNSKSLEINSKIFL